MVVWGAGSLTLASCLPIHYPPGHVPPLGAFPSGHFALLVPAIPVPRSHPLLHAMQLGASVLGPMVPQCLTLDSHCLL